MISPERYILNFFNVMYVPSSNRTALSLLPDARSSLAKTAVWFSIISSLEIFSKPRYFGTKLVTKASLTILIIRLKYRSLFTMNIVLKMLVDSPIMSYVSKRVHLKQKLFCLNLFYVENHSCLVLVD